MAFVVTMLQCSSDSLVVSPLKSCGCLSFSQNLLYNELLTFRGQLAHEAGIAPFLVGNNRLLGELARTR